jgi:hypothetical protein
VPVTRGALAKLLPSAPMLASACCAAPAWFSCICSWLCVELCCSLLGCTGRLMALLLLEDACFSAVSTLCLGFEMV